MQRIIKILIAIVLISASLLIGAGNLQTVEGFDWMLLFETRIPRTAALMLSGAGLALCGAIMQAVTQNIYASETTIGTVSAVRLGILATLLLTGTTTNWYDFVIIFLIGLTGTSGFFLLLKIAPPKLGSQITVPLLGLMYSGVLESFVTFIAHQTNLRQNMMAWTQGNFALIVNGQYELLYAIALIVIILFYYANYFTVLHLGETMASTLGLSYHKFRNLGIILSTLCATIIITVVGSLPFIGLIIPNIVRLRHGDHLRKNVWEITYVGAMFLLGCDIISRTLIRPYEVPVSYIIGIIGSLVFLYLLWGRKSYAAV